MKFELEQAIADFCNQLHITESKDEAIREEIASHLREKVAFFVRSESFNEEEAFARATDAVGDPQAYVSELRHVYQRERMVDRAGRILPIGGVVMLAHCTAAAIGSVLARPFILRANLDSPSGLVDPQTVMTCTLARWVIFITVYAGLLTLVDRYAGRLLSTENGLLTRITKAPSSMRAVVFLIALAVAFDSWFAGPLHMPASALVYTPIPPYAAATTLQSFATVSAHLSLPLIVIAMLTVLACRMDRQYAVKPRRTRMVALHISRALAITVFLVSSFVCMAFAAFSSIANPAALPASAMLLVTPLLMLIQTAFVAAIGCSLGGMMVSMMDRKKRHAA
jgi:heme/copper-type cytochrome/quinol oxidase subunit 3